MMVLVKKESYGWDFFPVIGTSEDMFFGYIVADKYGKKLLVDKDDVYEYYPEDDIEEGRMYFISKSILNKMGEKE